MDQPFGVMNALGITRDLGADDAGRIGLLLGTSTRPIERPSITSISSAQADGQSCGQVEWRISTLACWFMPKSNIKGGTAECIYPVIPMRKPQSDGSAAHIRPAIGVDRLSGDVAGRGRAEKPHHGGDILRLAPRASDGLWVR